MSDETEDAEADLEFEDETQAVITEDDLSLSARQWLRAIHPLLELRAVEPASSPRVQFALEEMLIAACDRASRILRSDQE